MSSMTDYDKLEYIHSYLQEVERGLAECTPPNARKSRSRLHEHVDCGMLPHAMAFVEQIREKHPQAPWNREVQDV